MLLSLDFNLEVWLEQAGISHVTRGHTSVGRNLDVCPGKQIMLLRIGRYCSCQSRQSEKGVLLSCRGPWIMKIETLVNGTESRCSMKPLGLMDILHENLFHFYIIEPMAKSVSLLKFKISVSPPNTPKRIILAPDFKLWSMCCTNRDWANTVYSVCYSPLKSQIKRG